MSLSLSHIPVSSIPQDPHLRTASRCLYIPILHPPVLSSRLSVLYHTTNANSSTKSNVLGLCPMSAPQHPPLTLSSVVRSCSLAWMAKAMRQMAAATHMRHCKPPASCRANLTYSGVPFGGLSALGPSRSSSSAARLAERPWGQRSEHDGG